MQSLTKTVPCVHDAITKKDNIEEHYENGLHHINYRQHRKTQGRTQDYRSTAPFKSTNQYKKIHKKKEGHDVSPVYT